MMILYYHNDELQDSISDIIDALIIGASSNLEVEENK